MAGAPSFHLPHREHLLFAGGLEDLLVIAGEFACAGLEYPELAARCRQQGSCLEPSLWWPQDRAWVVASEVDSDAVYVAGSRALAEQLLGERRLAAGEDALDDPITIED